MSIIVSLQVLPLVFSMHFFIWLSYCQTEKYSSWIDGSGGFISSIDSGQCHFKTIPNTTFPYRFIGLASSERWNDSQSCGTCFEIQCVGDWTNSLNAAECCQIDSTVTVQVTGHCSSCTDKDYFWLSRETKSKLQNNVTCNFIRTKYRRVSCDITDQNITIVNDFGVDYNYSLFVKNVAKYGTIAQVEMREFNKTTWLVGTHTSHNQYTFIGNTSLNTPLSIRITDTQGNNLTSYDLINDYTTTGFEHDFGANFGIERNSSIFTTTSSVPTLSPTRQTSLIPSKFPTAFAPTSSTIGNSQTITSTYFKWNDSTYNNSTFEVNTSTTRTIASVSTSMTRSQSNNRTTVPSNDSNDDSNDNSNDNSNNWYDQFKLMLLFIIVVVFCIICVVARKHRKCSNACRFVLNETIANRRDSDQHDDDHDHDHDANTNEGSADLEPNIGISMIMKEIIDKQTEKGTTATGEGDNYNYNDGSNQDNEERAHGELSNTKSSNCSNSSLYANIVYDNDMTNNDTKTNLDHNIDNDLNVKEQVNACCANHKSTGSNFMSRGEKTTQSNSKPATKHIMK